MGEVDAITLGVVWGGILAAAEEMGITLRRTAYSEAVREGQDFSTALFDARGRMIAQGNFSPGHLGSMPFAVGHVLREYPPETLHEDDAILLNDLYMGSGHLPDIFTIYPVFYKGRLAAFAVNVAHHIDVGGAVAGSQAVEGITEFYQEGIRLIPTRYQKEGVLNDEVMKFIASNVRVPDKVLGDLKAQTNANRIGARRIRELFDRYGFHTVTACMDELLDRSEAAMREEIRNIPDGTGSFEDCMDDYGRDTEPIKVKCTVTVEGDSLTIDYTGSGPQVPAGLNSPYNYTCAYAFCAIKNITDPSLPQNDGCLRPLKITAPEGSFFNPRPPAGAGGRAIISQRNYEAVMGAFSRLVPERVITAASHMANPVIGGYDPRRQRRFVHYVVGIGGFGARADKDGCEGLASAFNVRNIPVEVDEINYPIMVERLELIQDSAGAGKYRGGCGIRKDERMLGEDLRMSNLTDRVKFAPFGLFGGKPGAKTSVILNPGPDEQVLHSKGKYELNKGDLLSIRLAGCGGYGDPRQRDPEAVVQDVIAGFVSVEKAKDDYGVMIEKKKVKGRKIDKSGKRKGASGN